MKSLFASLAVAAVLGLAAAPPALAQSAGPGEDRMQTREPSPGAPESRQFRADELKSYASAAIEVKKINEAYTMKLQAAQTPQEQQSVREEATDRMVEAIRQEGLSVEKYNEIYNAAVTNPQVAEQLNEYLREAR